MVLLPTIWTIPLLALFAVSTGASGSESKSMRLVKRDPSGNPATVSHQNCATRYKGKFGSNPTQPFCNPGIQIGECFVNSRIHNNVFATFEPDDGPMTASREGGAYGRCCAYNTMPKEEDLIEVNNANYFCFAWTGPGKNIGAGLPSRGLPGMLAWPFPLICPGPIPNCYSLEYFDKGDGTWASHKLVGSADRYPNTTAYWQPPKLPVASVHKRPFLWCNGRGLGCPITTNRLFQTQNLANMECDASKCLPYKGDMTILQGDDRAKYAVSRGSAVAGIHSCNPSSDPCCGGPKLSGFGKSGSQGGSGSGSKGSGSESRSSSGSTTTPPKKVDPTSCDKKKDPKCEQSSTTPPPECDPDVDSKCTKTTKPPPSSGCDDSTDSSCKPKKNNKKTKKPKKCNKADANCSENGGTETATPHSVHKRHRNMQHGRSGWVV